MEFFPVQTMRTPDGLTKSIAKEVSVVQDLKTVLVGRHGTLFYQSTEQPLWREDQIHKEDPYKDATEPVKTHYYSPKVKAFLEKAG